MFVALDLSKLKEERARRKRLDWDFDSGLPLWMAMFQHVGLPDRHKTEIGYPASKHLKPAYTEHCIGMFGQTEHDIRHSNIAALAHGDPGFKKECRCPSPWLSLTPLWSPNEVARFSQDVSRGGIKYA